VRRTREEKGERGEEDRGIIIILFDLVVLWSEWIPRMGEDIFSVIDYVMLREWGV
jgi:hypothetical protein